MNDQIFEKLTTLEELLRKNRGLTYLLSRVAGAEQDHAPDELAALGIRELSDELSHELGKAYVDVFHACKHGVIQLAGGGAIK